MGLPEDIQRQVQATAKAANDDPIRYLAFHEGLRIYHRDGTPDLGDAGPSPRSEATNHVEFAAEREKAGDIGEAESALQTAAERGSTYALFRLGFIAEVHRKDDDRAIDCYRQADEAGDANGSSNLGRMLKDRGELLAAEQAFGRGYHTGATRALADYAGLMSIRSTTTTDELASVVVELCKVEDVWFAAEAEALRGEDSSATDRVSSAVGPPLQVFAGMWDRCDPVAMEAGVRAADAAGSASGAFHLGLLLRARDERREAALASTRAGERGLAQGWTDAAISLEEAGDLYAAANAARNGQEAGHVGASVVLGLILDKLGDPDGSIAANRRADEAGDATGALHLGIDLLKKGDLDGADQAFIRAHERGEPSAAQRRDVVRQTKAR
jgi:tetratricopeptide (TPR) repeat protein